MKCKLYWSKEDVIRVVPPSRWSATITNHYFLPVKQEVQWDGGRGREISIITNKPNRVGPGEYLSITNKPNRVGPGEYLSIANKPNRVGAGGGRYIMHKPNRVGGGGGGGGGRGYQSIAAFVLSITFMECELYHTADSY